MSSRNLRSNKRPHTYLEVNVDFLDSDNDSDYEMNFSDVDIKVVNIVFNSNFSSINCTPSANTNNYF